MIKKYRLRKLPVIEAVQFDGDNYLEVANFAPDSTVKCGTDAHTMSFLLSIVGEPVEINKNDYIVKVNNTHVYPCTQDMFESTYEPIHE